MIDRKFHQRAVWQVEFSSSNLVVAHTPQFGDSVDAVVLGGLPRMPDVDLQNLIDKVNQNLLPEFQNDIQHTEKQQGKCQGDGAFLESENNMRLSTHIHMKLGTLGNQLTEFIVI